MRRIVIVVAPTWNLNGFVRSSATGVIADGFGDATSQATLQVMSVEHLKIAEPTVRDEDARPRSV